MNKNTVLVGRGGFEPKRNPKKSLFFNAFSDYSPILRQIVFMSKTTFKSNPKKVKTTFLGFFISSYQAHFVYNTTSDR